MYMKSSFLINENQNLTTFHLKDDNETITQNFERIEKYVCQN